MNNMAFDYMVSGSRETTKAKCSSEHIVLDTSMIGKLTHLSAFQYLISLGHRRTVI